MLLALGASKVSDVGILAEFPNLEELNLKVKRLEAGRRTTRSVVERALRARWDVAWLGTNAQTSGSPTPPSQKRAPPGSCP